jgi:hypothetical protein
MANLHDRNSNHRDGNVDETVYLNGNADPARASSYRDGYVHGRVAESRIEEERLEVRDNNNAARGLFIGILLTSLLGITLAALYYWNQRQQVAPAIVVPVPTSPAPAANQQPNGQTTVIERQVEQVPQVVPVPQQPAAAPQQSAPKINVTVPQQQAPAPKVNVTVPSAAQQPAPRQNTTVNVTPPQSPTTPSGTANDTTTPGTQNQTGTSPGGNSDAGSPTN